MNLHKGHARHKYHFGERVACIEDEVAGAANAHVNSTFSHARLLLVSLGNTLRPTMYTQSGECRNP